jgi:hypothetical protein
MLGDKQGKHLENTEGQPSNGLGVKGMARLGEMAWLVAYG